MFHCVLVVDAAVPITVRLSDLFVPSDVAPSSSEARRAVAVQKFAAFHLGSPECDDGQPLSVCVSWVSVAGECLLLV